MFVVVVPLVVTAIERLLERLSTLGPEGPVRDLVVAEIVTPEEVRRIVRSVGSLHARTQVDALTQALRRSLARHLEDLCRAQG